MKKKAAVEPKPVKVELLRWSYSSWSTYDECGARFAFRYSQKIPDKPSPAMARGTEIHTDAEMWTQTTKKVPLPPNLKKLAPQFEALRKAKPQVEAWWGVDKEWKPVKYGGWLVAKIDAFVQVKNELIIIDHKTGRVYADKHEKQASLYAALGGIFFPKVKRVVAEMWYLDQGSTLTWEWNREQVEQYQALWDRRGKEVMAHPNLNPRPGWYCKWCPYSKANAGGACKAG